MNKNQLQKETRLKTCFQNIQDYLGLSNHSQLKKILQLSLPSSQSHQYRKRANTSKMQRTKTYQQYKNNSKINQQNEVKQQIDSKTGFFDILRVKMHSNERYNRNAIESWGSSIVNRKNFKSYLKVQVQKQFNSKEAYQIKVKTNDKQSNKRDDNAAKKIINSKIQEIIKKFAKSHKQVSNKSNPQKTIFHRREINQKNLKNKIFINKTMDNFVQNPKINPFLTIVGWQVQSNQQLQQKL